MSGQARAPGKGLLFASFEMPAPPPGAARASVDMVSAQDLIMIGACKRHGGELVRSSPSSCQAVFESPERAAACAMAARLRFVGHNRRHAPLRRVGVRFGLSAGEAARADGALAGPDAELAAGLAGIAPPGRIFCSRDVYMRTLGKLPCAFVPLGHAPLKGVREPAEVFDLLPLAGLDPDGPLPASRATAEEAGDPEDWARFAALLKSFIGEDRPA